MVFATKEKGAKMEKLKSMICPQCGGAVNRATMICEYCGTRFREDDSGIKIEVLRPGVRVLSTTFEVPDEFMYSSPKDAAAYAIDRMAEQFAECIAPYIDVKMQVDPAALKTRFYASLRVIDSKHRF